MDANRTEIPTTSHQEVEPMHTRAARRPRGSQRIPAGSHDPIHHLRRAHLRVSGSRGEELARDAGGLVDHVDDHVCGGFSTTYWILDEPDDFGLRLRHERLVHRIHRVRGRVDVRLHCLADVPPRLREQIDGEEQGIRRSEFGLEIRWSRPTHHDPSVPAAIQHRQWSDQHDSHRHLATVHARHGVRDA